MKASIMNDYFINDEYQESDNFSQSSPTKKFGKLSGSIDFLSTRSTNSGVDLKHYEEDFKTTKLQSMGIIDIDQESAREELDEQSIEYSLGELEKIEKAKEKAELNKQLDKTFNDINYIFMTDETKFIGEFKTDKYRIIRGFINSTKHLRLHYTKLEHYTTRIASLAIIHGYAEHSARFLEMADHFVRQGFVVHLVDLRGFGYSGGTHGVATIEELHDDIKLLLEQVGTTLPLFLYGHSIGASLLSSFLMRNKWIHISGVILTSAVFGFAKDRNINYLKRFFIRTLGSYFEEVVISGRISSTTVSKNNYQIKHAVDDQVASPFVTLRMAKNAIELIDYIIPNAHKFRHPVLIIHGMEDKITKCEDSVKFYNRISSTDKTLRVFKDGFHELHHDVEKEKLKSIVSDWMKKKLSSSRLKNFCILEEIRTGLKEKRFRLWHKLVLLCLTILYFRSLNR